MQNPPQFFSTNLIMRLLKVHECNIQFLPFLSILNSKALLQYKYPICTSLTTPKSSFNIFTTIPFIPAAFLLFIFFSALIIYSLTTVLTSLSFPLILAFLTSHPTSPISSQNKHTP